METSDILEGTWEELKRHEPELAGRKFRLIPIPEEEVTDTPVEPNETEPDTTRSDAKNARAVALLQSWLREEATEDPEQIRQAEEELAEFKRNLNANRANTGERLLFVE